MARQRLGRSLSIVCAGVPAYLGATDAACFRQTGLFARGVAIEYDCAAVAVGWAHLGGVRTRSRGPATMMVPRYLYRAAAIPWLHVRSFAGAMRDRPLFRGVESYCQFIGYPRSGHTLVYALLNAHPEVALSNELGVLQWLRFGFSRDQLYSMILRADRRFADEGFTFQGYDYHVPNQWQGRFRTLRVIGDKDGGRDTMRLRRRPELLAQLRSRVGVPIRFVHVVRNPFDMLATFMNRRNRRGEHTTLEEALSLAREALDGVVEVARGIPDDSLMTIRHEDMIREPALTLRRLCEHVGVGADDEYLEDCGRVVFRSPRQTRRTITLTPEVIEQVQVGMVGRYDFLAGYTYET